MWPEKYFQTLLKFQRIICKKESEEVCVLIWTKFGSFAHAYLIEVACFKEFHFPIDVLNSLQIPKRIELAFRSQFL